MQGDMKENVSGYLFLNTDNLRDAMYMQCVVQITQISY